MLSLIARSLPHYALAIIKGDQARERIVIDKQDIRRLWILYLVVLSLFLLVVQLMLPIVMTDTDMWYHLNGGRYFWTTGEVPHSSFFSYLQPQRVWSNYFWGFQALIYKVYELFGYQGLVVFRSILFILTYGLVMAIVFADKRAREHPALFFILSVLVVVVLDGRSVAVRPHMVSYLFIVFFIYVLQHRTRWAPVLPVATVVWMNLHGVEWVVGALIGAAYLIEHVYQNWDKASRRNGLNLSYVFSILACAAAVLATPNGLKLILIPFSHESDIFRFIAELLPVDSKIYYSLQFSLKSLNVDGSVTMLLVMEVLGVVLLLVRKRLRVSHAIMAMGGLYLLLSGVRFVWEWTLLSLPLIHSAILEFKSIEVEKYKIVVWRSLVLFYFLAMPFSTFGPRLAVDFHNYPFNSEGLPVGSEVFFKQINAKGTLLATPNVGGYFQWAVYPDLLIHSDMEFPPFTSVDMYTATWALNNSAGLGHLLERIDLDFIAVKLSNSKFRGFASEFDQFVPVFFDDSFVIFANSGKHPELVKDYEIHYLDPFNLLAGKGTSDQRIEELLRIERVYPNGRRVNHALTWLLFQEKRFSDALIYAEKFWKHYPDDPNSNYWLGNILENMDRCNEAAPFFENALKYSDSTFSASIKKHLGTCAYLSKQFGSAYDWFSEGMNPFVRDESANDMYQYAFSAAAIGKVDEAVRMLDLLLYKLEDSDEDIRDKAESFRDDLLRDEELSPGVLSWLRSLID